jgi:hypothetical protein
MHLDIQWFPLLRVKQVKVKLSRYTPYRSLGEEFLLIPDLGTTLSGQPHISAALYIRGRKHQYPLDRRPGEPQSRSGTTTLFPCQWSNPGRPVRSWTLYCLNCSRSCMEQVPGVFPLGVRYRWKSRCTSRGVKTTPAINIISGHNLNRALFFEMGQFWWNNWNLNSQGWKESEPNKNLQRPRISRQCWWEGGVPVPAPSSTQRSVFWATTKWKLPHSSTELDLIRISLAKRTFKFN